MDLKKDEQSFLKTLVRPMPRKPSPAATRGTKFHAWVEEFYHKRALIDPETLPGAGDSDIYSDEVLAQMKEAFQTGLFAERPNAELELPFALVIKGRTWRGRIDAIFKGTLENPDAPGWLVVDWKTGKSGTADELQLSIYRHALAELKQCDPEEVQAAFYYVSEKVVAFPQKLLSREDLEDLI
jgi:DNA helicase-2/ATP-dependent DNA helicase PcrA